jgi:hypothetical protein
VRSVVPAASRGKAIGVYLACLDHQPHGSIRDALALERQALLEPPVLDVEALAGPQRKRRPDGPFTQPIGRWHETLRRL